MFHPNPKVRDLLKKQETSDQRSVVKLMKLHVLVHAATMALRVLVPCPKSSSVIHLKFVSFEVSNG